jgi:hypothetical protein
MALIESFANGTQTQLNKLKFGEIASIGNVPIVTKKIPTGLRENGPSSNEVSRRIDDLKRIGTLLTQKPGLKWIANETLLNKASVEIKPKPDGTDRTGVGSVLATVGANLFNSVKIIGSTLAQVPLNGTGTHFVKGFAGNKGYLERTIGGAKLENSGLKGEKTQYQEVDGYANRLEKATGIKVSPPKETVKLSKQAAIAALGTSELQARVKLNKYAGIDVEPRVGNIVRKESRIGVSDHSFKRTKANSTEYWSPSENAAIDKVNIKGIVDKDDFKAATTAELGRDIIKFRFNIITPDVEKVLFFRAYLTSFTDNYAGNWNSFNYVGRGEDFFTYQGFNRTISVGFTISANTRHEMRPLYQKIVALASATAPTYTEQGYMRGTIAKLTVGDYVDKQYGIIESVNYSWDQNYPWEIAMNTPQAKEGENEADFHQQELPMLLNCQVNFRPIHEFVPQTGLYHYITSNNKLNNGAKFFDKTTSKFGGTEVPEATKT